MKQKKYRRKTAIFFILFQLMGVGDFKIFFTHMSIKDLIQYSHLRVVIFSQQYR